MSKIINNASENIRRLVLSHIMTPDMINFSGNIHGGHVLRDLDQVAYACAVQYCKHNVVTLSVDQVLFKQPIYAGEMVKYLSNINYVGRTSMEVGIRVVAHNLKAGTERHVMTCYFTMVAMDDDMKPCSVPALIPETEEEKRWYKAAEGRRKIRMDAAAAHQS